eukprot:GABV01008813.1.p1 GENE.GABV01008813.1~~GABV01008813.1.p1  ORF type:complete len:332 (-),score=127.74 GABV01008813.1:7-927(-)
MDRLAPFETSFQTSPEDHPFHLKHLGVHWELVADTPVRTLKVHVRSSLREMDRILAKIKNAKSLLAISSRQVAPARLLVFERCHATALTQTVGSVRVTLEMANQLVDVGLKCAGTHVLPLFFAKQSSKGLLRELVGLALWRCAVFSQLDPVPLFTHAVVLLGKAFEQEFQVEIQRPTKPANLPFDRFSRRLNDLQHCCCCAIAPDNDESSSDAAAAAADDFSPHQRRTLAATQAGWAILALVMDARFFVDERRMGIGFFEEDGTIRRSGSVLVHPLVPLLSQENVPPLLSPPGIWAFVNIFSNSFL